jgi:hypothetical protein
MTSAKFTLTPRVIVRGDPINEYLKDEAMKAKHTMIVKWCEHRRAWTAHSDTFGADSSPEGEGESPTEAIEDLIEQLTDREERCEP